MEDKNMQFTIVLPVHNGGEYVKECIGSVLRQSYHEFELLVLENNSIDGTYEWLLSLRDDRIRIEPADHFLSLEENFSRISLFDTRDFITFIGHDDLIDPGYLSSMCELINKHPDASLYQTHFRYIDADSVFLRSCMPICEMQQIHEFVAKQFMRTMDSMGTGYMMRRKDYDVVGGFSDYKNLIFSDYELWVKLISHGYLATSPLECFSCREHMSASVSTKTNDYFNGLSRYVTFLGKMAKENDLLMNVIGRYADDYLEIMCKELIYRGIRLRRFDDQKGAENIVCKFRELKEVLVPFEKGDLALRLHLRFAVLIDRWIVFRFLYLLAMKGKYSVRKLL